MKKRRVIFFLMFAIILLVASGIPKKESPDTSLQVITAGKKPKKPKKPPVPSLQSIIAGRNVNMVSGTEWPGGDPWLQRQNEPSIAVSTRNPLHLLAGSNDYRSIDVPDDLVLPGTEGDEPIAAKEAWLGVYTSDDGGQSWTSTLHPGYPHPGYPQGASLETIAFREKMNELLDLDPLDVTINAAADPVVRAGTNGLFYFCGIAFNRDSKNGVLFVSRYIDNNNQESGEPIKYIDTIFIDGAINNDNGEIVFIDKPWIAVDLPRNASDKVEIKNPLES